MIPPTSKDVVAYLDGLFGGDTQSVEINKAEWIAVKKELIARRHGLSAEQVAAVKESLLQQVATRIRASDETPAEPEWTREAGWLIENGKSGDALRYRTMEQGMPAWTADNLKALRFARRADAEMFAAEDDAAWRIAEHIWSGPPQVKTSDQSSGRIEKQGPLT